MTIVNPEILPEMITGKNSRLDINCTFDDGNAADMELQCSMANDSQRNRALYYGAKLTANSVSEGDSYKDMKMSYQVMIVDYKEFRDKNDDDFYTEFVMYSKKKEIVLSECEKIIFIELPKLKKLINSNFDELSPLQFWSILLKYNNDEKIREKLHSIAKFQEDNNMADKTLDQICASRKAWAINLSLEGGKIDYNTNIDYAERMGLRKGLRKGMKKGLEKGLKQGEHKHAVETARRMMKKNYKYDDIAEMTGLTIDEIKELR